MPDTRKCAHRPRMWIKKSSTVITSQMITSAMMKGAGNATDRRILITA
jgi:hypothetical protein